MAASFFTSGTAVRRRDSRLTVWKKILFTLQTGGDELPENDPRRRDTLRVTRQKVLCAIKGVPFNA